MQISKSVLSRAIVAAMALGASLPVSARFLSRDPVQTNPNTGESFNRYYYANNNPYRFTDPDGRAVVANTPEEGRRISGWINERAQGTYEFDASNNLARTSEGVPSSDRSSSYSRELDTAIASDKTATMFVRQTVPDKTSGTEVDIDVQFKGGITGRAEDGIQVYVTGNDSVLTAQDGSSYLNTPADTVMHEVTAHVLPMMGHPNTGNGIENENKLRGEIDGLPLRRVLPHPEIRD